MITEDKLNYKDNFIGEGYYATCYKLDNNKVYKKYTDKDKYENLNNIKMLMNMKYDGFIFPEEFVYSEKKKLIHGHLMDYAIGETFQKVYQELSITEFKKIILNYQKKLLELTKDKITVSDLNFDNFIYHNKNITSIDTDTFIVNDDEYSDNKNIISLNKGIILYLFEDGLLSNFFDYNIYGNNINDYFKLAKENGDINSVELIEIFSEFFKEITRKEITSVREFQKISKFARK